MDEKKVKPEDLINPSDKYLEVVGDLYTDFYKFRNARSGVLKQLQYNTFEDFLSKSRHLFWNSTVTQSDDLKELGLEFALPFIRKEVIDFVGRLVSLNINPHLSGDELNQYAIRVLNAVYSKWRIKSNDKVEKFWQVLYGVVNGTVCNFVGWNDAKHTKRYLTSYDPQTGDYNIDKKEVAMWNDVYSEIVTLEELYLEKMWERNIQKQNRTIRKQEMTLSDFQKEFKNYKNAKYVLPGGQIAEDSLFHDLLEGSGILNTDKIQVFTEFKTGNEDAKIVVANGVWLNPLKGDVTQPSPFIHKMQPYTWSQMFQPIDEKFAYGLSLPFMEKDPHKLLNTSYTFLVESELRAIDPPYLSSDIEAPELIFGQKKVIPVTDVNAFKQIEVKEPSSQFFAMMNSLSETMTSQAQGGATQIMPSRQPKAAREIIAMENMRQQTMSSSLLMYYNMVYQEIMLILKTAMQFYAAGKYYNEEISRVITVPNSPLVGGGIGQLEVRIKKEPSSTLKLFFESIDKSIANGKTTEIIEISPEVIGNLEWFIEQITLDPEKTPAMEKAEFYEQVLQPMVNVFIPMGLADPAKVFKRWLDKFGEHPADYVNDQVLPQMLANQGRDKYNQVPQMQSMQMPGRQDMGAQTGNMNQSMTGMRFGSQSNGGFGAELYL